MSNVCFLTWRVTADCWQQQLAAKPSSTRSFPCKGQTRGWEMVHRRNCCDHTLPEKNPVKRLLNRLLMMAVFSSNVLADFQACGTLGQLRRFRECAVVVSRMGGLVTFQCLEGSADSPVAALLLRALRGQKRGIREYPRAFDQAQPSPSSPSDQEACSTTQNTTPRSLPLTCLCLRLNWQTKTTFPPCLSACSCFSVLRQATRCPPSNQPWSLVQGQPA